MDLLGIVSLMNNQFRSYTNITLIASGMDVHPHKNSTLVEWIKHTCNKITEGS